LTLFDELERDLFLFVGDKCEILGFVPVLFVDRSDHLHNWTELAEMFLDLFVSDTLRKFSNKHFALFHLGFLARYFFALDDMGWVFGGCLDCGGFFINQESKPSTPAGVRICL